MLTTTQKKLTSNKLVNQLLLLNPTLTTTLFKYGVYDNDNDIATHSLLHIMCVEYYDNRLSEEEFIYVLDEAFGVRKRFNQIDSRTKSQFAYLGFYLDLLEHETSFDIKLALVSHGHFLDKFTYDRDDEIRLHVAEQHHNLHILKDDRCEKVRNYAKHALQERENQHVKN